MRRIRWLNRVYAYVRGYFWLPCPLCGEMFGGHECGTKSVELTSRPVLPGLREEGVEVDVTVFPRRRIACWRHG